MRDLLRYFFVTLAVSLTVNALSPSVGFADDEAADGAKNSHPAGKTGVADGHDAHAKTGVPLSFDGDLAVWSGIVFILFLVVLKTFAWGPLSDGLAKREAAIRKDIDDAQQARVEAEQMLADHAEKLSRVQDEVREIIAEARRDAERTKQEINETAQREADATKGRSIAEIERARDAALKELFDAVSAQVAGATEHVLGRTLNDGDRERLIDEALSQFSQN